MTKLVEYNQEIQPILRNIEKKKELIKDFKTTDEKALKLQQNIKDMQEELKAYLESDDDIKAYMDEVAALTKDFKEASKLAARSVGKKPAIVSAYFKARCKDNVDKIVEKGEIFNSLESELE